MVLENFGDKYVIVNLSLCTVASILHSFGFFVLWRVKQKNPYLATQRLYLMHLSISENIYSIFYGLFFVFDLTFENSTWKTVIYIIAGGGAYVWYLLILIMLTIDRFLTVYFNIRYIAVWSIRKAKQVLALCFLVSFIASILFAIYLQNLKEAYVFLTLYIWVPVDSLFVTVSIFTYIYIYWNILKRKNKVARGSLNRLSNEISTNRDSPINNSNNSNNNDNDVKNYNNTNHSNHTNNDVNNYNNTNHTNNNTNNTTNKKGVPKKSFLVPILLITTFVIFISLPDLVSFVYMVAKVKQPVFLELLFYILYPIGLISDALIYIILSKDVANYFLKLTKCNSFT